MENSIIDNSELVQNVLMASPNVVLVLQPIFSIKGGRLDLFLTSINAAAQKELNCPAREVLGQSFSRFFPHLADSETIGRYWDVISKGQPDQFDIFCTRSGQSAPSVFKVSAVPMLHNLLITYIEIPQTPSEDDDTGESGSTLLQQAFNEAANGLSVFEVILDEHGQPSDFRLVMLNKAGRVMSGSLGEELVGKTLWEMYPATKINGLFDRYVQVWQTGVLFSSEHYYPEYDIWRDVKIVRVEQGVLVSYTDITALKKSEEQARQQAQLVDDLLERVPIGIAVLTPVKYETSVGGREVYFQVVRVNSLFEEVIGLSASQTVGQFINRLLPKTNAEGLLRNCLAALESGKTQVIEMELTAYSLSRWYQLSIAPKGEQLIVSFTNITSLKQAQQHQMELLDSVLSGSQNAILAFDAIRDSDGTIVDFRYLLQNEAKRQLAGRTDEQTLGRTMLDVFPQVREKGLLDRYIEVVKTGYPLRTQTEFTYGNKKGWYDLSAVKYGDGLVLTIQEKTVEQQILHQLQTNAELLQTIIDNIPSGLVFWEAVRDDRNQLIDFRYRLSNLINSITTGYLTETLMGQNLLQLFPYLRETPLEAALREVVEMGQTQRMVFTDYIEPGRGWFDAQFIRVGDGVLMSYIDVTEARQAKATGRPNAADYQRITDRPRPV
ncbi:PAS domain-containing protein [Spirosoma jeollabukense]